MDFVDFVETVGFLSSEVRLVNKGEIQKDTVVWLNKDLSLGVTINGDVELPVLKQICIIDVGSDFKLYFHYLSDEGYLLKISFLLSEVSSIEF